MTREDVIRMAREAGAAEFYPSAQSVKEQNYVVSAGFLERFAALVAAAEREACAKVCESRYMGDNNREDVEAKACAAAIRARGQDLVQTCCAGGPQWGHAWDCKELP